MTSRTQKRLTGQTSGRCKRIRRHDVARAAARAALSCATVVLGPGPVQARAQAVARPVRRIPRGMPAISKPAIDCIAACAISMRAKAHFYSHYCDQRPGRVNGHLGFSPRWVKRLPHVEKKERLSACADLCRFLPTQAPDIGQMQSLRQFLATRYLPGSSPCASMAGTGRKVESSHSVTKGEAGTCTGWPPTIISRVRNCGWLISSCTELIAP